MKKRLYLSILIVGMVSLLPAYSQQPDIWPWPYPASDESGFHFLPVGGWNTPGSLSPNSLAMGESYLTAGNSTSGFLNPASLSFLSAPQFSLSYRYTENRYKISSWPSYMELPILKDSSETRSFRRKADSIDSAGLVLPFENWVLAANYFVFQDYNFPDLEAPDWGYPVPMVRPEICWLASRSIAQTGRMKGLNLAFSYRLTESFSLGASASYVFGDIERFEEMPEVYIVEPQDGGDSTPPSFSDFSSTTQSYVYDAKGFFYNLGLTWEPSRQVSLGFSLRLPFSLDIQTEMEFTSSGQTSYFSRDNYFQHPLVAVASVLFRPRNSFHLTADLSYWGWGETSTDIDPGWLGSYDFKSVLKLNLGAEYWIGLPFEVLQNLGLRAGFIYDPQPYRSAPRIARDFVTFGLTLPAGRLDLSFAAKIGLSSREKNRFHSDVLQVGAGYRF
jgi:hypothetical protein